MIVLGRVSWSGSLGRRSGIVVALVLVLVTALGCSAPSDDSSPGGQSQAEGARELPAADNSAGAFVESFTLENGLQVYVTERRSAPVVTVMLGYQVGSRDEPIGKRGMAHLLEHMLFKGTPQFGPGEYDRLIQSVGGSLNAFTSFDMTGYWATVPSSRLDLVLQLEADRMENTLITEEALKSEREVVKEEYRLRMQNAPGGLAVNHLFASVFKETPYAWTASGFLEDLDQIATDDLLRFYRQYYSVNNAVLVVVGDVEPDQVSDLVNRHFGDLQPRTQPERESVEARSIPEGRPVAEVVYPVQAPLLVGVYMLPAAGDPDAPALEVLGALLSLGESSRMHDEVVRTRQVAVAASAGPLTLKDAGLFVLEAVHTPAVSVNQVKEALESVVAGVVASPPTSDELRKAINQLTLVHALQLDSVHSTAMGLAEATLLSGDPTTFTQALERYRAVSVDDVVRVAKEYLVSQSAQWVSVAPGEDS